MNSLISFADIQAEITRITKAKALDDDGFYPAVKWTEMLGLSTHQMKVALLSMHKSGLVEVTHRLVPDISGRMRSIPVYRIHTQKKKGKK